MKMAKYHDSLLWPPGMNIMDSEPNKGTTIRSSSATSSNSFNYATLSQTKMPSPTEPRAIARV